MQRIATRVFIGASVLFGILGVTAVVFGLEDEPGLIERLLFATGFVVLSSFALSVAGKYLSSDDD
jgi:hypothetical protein